jgi:P pilus assembly chaperone PapD
VIVCDKCGHENADGRQFCEACDEYLVWRGKSVSATMASLTPAEVTVKPGAEATAQLRIFNRGSIVDKFSFDVPADLAAWTSVEPEALNLYPNTNGDATIRFHPPRSPELRAGPVAFTIKVRSDVNPGTSAEAAGTVTVDPFTEIAARLVPATSRSTGTAEHQIKTGNGGNAAAEISLSVANPDDQLVFELESEKVTLQPGEGSSVKLLVSPRDPDQLTQGVPQPFRVTLTAPDTPDVTLDGAYQRVTLVQLGGSLDPESSSSVGTAEHWVTINNKGNAPAAVTVSASDPEQQLAFQITPSNLTVEGGGSARARLWVGLRQRGASQGEPGDPGGVSIPFQVVARAGESSPVELSGTYTPLVVQMTATLEPRISRAKGMAQHSLTIVNNGNRPATVSIVATDADEVLALSVNPPSLAIEPGGGARATVWVTLRDRWAPGGGDPLPFEVRLIADSSTPITVSGAYVPLFAQLTGTLDPPSSEGIGTGEQWVVVTNTGNLNAEAVLTATDPAHAFNFELAPNWVQLEPGKTVRVRLRLTPRRHLRGDPEPRPFQVDIASETAPPINLQGTRTQIAPPREPRRWPPVVLRILAAIACLVIGLVIALSTLQISLAIENGATTYQIPFVSIATAALGVLGFLIFIPRRGWFIAVGVLAAGAVGIWLLSTLQMLKL